MLHIQMGWPPVEDLFRNFGHNHKYIFVDKAERQYYCCKKKNIILLFSLFGRYGYDEHVLYFVLFRGVELCNILIMIVATIITKMRSYLKRLSNSASQLD